MYIQLSHVISKTEICSELQNDTKKEMLIKEASD